MIQSFVDSFMNNKEEIREVFSKKHPEDYREIVEIVVRFLNTEQDSVYTPTPDVERIHVIDDGHYQGTLVFVIGANGYQPSTYWYVMVDYGSCSGCDTFEAIRGYGDALPTEEQVNDYMTLAIHIVQGLKKMYDDEEER